MSSVRSIKFGSKFIRTGGNVSFQERGAQPSDFNAQRGFAYAGEWAADPSGFWARYPSWQAFADCYVMRRAIIGITGCQKCETRDFRADELEKYLNPGFVSLKYFAVPGLDRGSIPRGKYQLRALDFKDNGDTFTLVTVSYQQYAEWKLVQIETPVPPEAGAEA